MDISSPLPAPAQSSNRAVAIGGAIPACVAASLLAAISAWCYWPTIVEIVSAWTSNPDYTHGFCVLPIAAALLWTRRDLLVQTPINLDLRGLWLIAIAGMVRYASGRFYLPELDAWSVPIWIAGIAWLLGGWAFFRFAWPAIAFLWFATPLPGTLEIALSTPLQKVAAESSAYVLRVLRQPALAEGTTILLDEHVLDVERACSGLRMFYGIFALAVACVIATRPPRWKAALLILAAPPIAVIANVVRISATGMLIKYSTSEAAHKFSHDLAGLVMIPLATCLFVLLLFALKRLSSWPTLDRRVVIRRVAVYSLLTVVVVGGVMLWGKRQETAALATLRVTSDRYATESNWPRAIEYLARYVRAVPADKAAFAEYAELYRDHAVHVSDRRRAQGLLAKAWQLQPDRVPLAVDSIKLALGNEEFRSAVVMCDAVLKQSLTRDRVIEFLQLRADAVLAYVQAGGPRADLSWDDARVALEKAIDVPNAKVSHVESLAEIYRQHLPKMKPGEAEKLADQLLAKAVNGSKGDPLPWLARHRYRLKYAKSEQDRLAAKSDLSQAIELAEKSAGAEAAPVLVAAALDTMRSGDTQQATKYLEKAIRLAPTEPRAYTLLAEVNRTSGGSKSRAAAIELLERGLQKANRYEVALALPLASLLVEEGKLDEGESHVEKLEQFVPLLQGAERGTLLVGIGLVRSQLLQSRSGPKVAAKYLSGVTNDTDVRLAESQTPELLAPTRVVLAEMYVRQNQFEQAVDSYQQAIAAKPDMFNWRLRMAQLAQQIGDFDLAEQSFRSVVGRQPATAAMWSTAVGIEMARQMQRPPTTRDWTRMRQFIAAAERLGAPPIAVTMCEVDVLMADGKLDEAEPKLVALTQANPKEPSVWRALAIMHAQRRDFAAALEAADHAVRESNDMLANVVLRADLLADAGKPDEAVAQLQSRADKAGPDEYPNAALAVARLLSRLGKHAEATAYLESAHARSPQSESIVDNLAEKSWLAQDWTALAKYEQQLKQIEGDEGTLCKLYRAERLLHQSPMVSSTEFREVLAHADDLLRRRPRWPRVHFLRGEIAQRQGHVDAAIADFERSWRYGGRNIVVAERLIDLLTQQGKFAEVQQYVEKFRDLLPQSEALFDRAAPALTQGADGGEMLTIAENWVQRKPQDVDARLRLARVLFLRSQLNGQERAADLSQAEKQLRAAIELAPDDFRTWVATVVFYARTDQSLERAIRTVNEFASKNQANVSERDFVVAQLYEALSMPVEAHQFFQQVAERVAANPKAAGNVEQLSRMAMFYQGRVPLLAERYASEALQTDPNEPRALGVMLNLLVARSDKVSAAAGLTLLESSNLSKGILDESTEHRLRAILLSQRDEPGDVDLAIELLQGSIDRTRQDSLLLAGLYERAGRVVPALELLEPLVNAPDAIPNELAVFLGFCQRNFAVQNGAKSARFSASARNVYERLGQLPGQLAEGCRWQLRDMKLKNRNVAPAAEQIVAAVQTALTAALADKTRQQSPQQLLQQMQIMLLQEGYGEAAEALTLAAADDAVRANAAVSLCHAFVAVPAAPEMMPKRLSTLEKIAAQYAGEATVVQAVGDSLFMSGEYHRSIDCYRRVLELQSNHPYVRNNLAMALGERRKLKEAEAMLAPVLAERPNDPAVLDTQATLELIGGHPDQARDILTTAVKLRPEDAVMRLHLAAAYEALHDADRVRKHLLTALAAGVERQVLTPRDRASLTQLQAAYSVSVVAARDSRALDQSSKVSSN